MIDSKPHVVVLYSHNPSRLAHLRKLQDLRERYALTLVLDHAGDQRWQREYVDRVVTVSMRDARADLEEIVRTIEAIGRPDAILNLSEACVPLQALLCERWGIKGPSWRAAEIGRNKHLMRKFLRDQGIPVPRFALLDDAVDEALKELRFPVVVKPVIGGGSTLVRRFETRAELDASIDELRRIAVETYKNDSLFRSSVDSGGGFPFIVEEIIGGETQFPTRFSYPVGEVSVESICHDGRTRILAMHDKPLPANGPHFEEYVWSTPSRIPASLQAKAKEYVSRIHAGLGDGAFVLHTEFRTLRDEVMALEFGVRLGGGPIYRSVLHSTGNDFLELLIELSLGDAPTLSAREPVPTITHCLWAEREGRIKEISGESKAIRDASYREHQIYDDVGEVALRAPRSCRSNGHIVFQKPGRDFDDLERRVLQSLDTFRFVV